MAILLAVYNGEKFLAEQIDSIVRQTVTDWTLYIRDDASTDGTRRIIDGYLERYPGKVVEIDRGGPNLGCSGNFFRLLEAVESTYYVFSDADDVWFDDKLEVSLAAIRRQEEKYPDTPVLVFGDAVVCDAQMNVVEPSLWKSTGIKPEKFLSYNYAVICCHAGGSRPLFNQRAKEAIPPAPDPRLTYDYWIALNIARAGRLGVIHRPLTYYRQHENQVCGIGYGRDTSTKYRLKHLRGGGGWFENKGGGARQRPDFGYGPQVKYYWYKFLTLLKIRFGV